MKEDIEIEANIEPVVIKKEEGDKDEFFENIKKHMSVQLGKIGAQNYELITTKYGKALDDLVHLVYTYKNLSADVKKILMKLKKS